MSKKYGTFSSDFLQALGEGTGLFSWPLEGSNAWIRQQLSHRGRKNLYNTARNFHTRGWLKIVEKNGKKFLKLTNKGQLELLVRKAALAKPDRWDNQWRIIMFDIPEKSKEKRNLLRSLLKRSGYIQMQASVFINPYPLNREAVSYLKESGLIQFIRIVRAVEIDDDSKLRKKFNLPTDNHK